MAREMKDSGVDLVGKIPFEWVMKPIKAIASYNDETLNETTDEYFEFDYIDIGSVQYGKGITQYQRMKFKDAPSRARRIVRCNDTIVSTVRTYLKAIAKIDDSDFPQVASTGFVVIRAKEILPLFLYYALLSEAFICAVESHSTGISYPAINGSDVVRLKIPIPPSDEQKRICIFLDNKCAEIDTVLEKTRTSIEEYKKLKQAIITQAVTKGVRGDRPMKESGIAWIGSIPSEWDVSTLGKFIAIDSGISIGRKYELETPLVEVPYLRVANVQGDHLDLSDVATIMVTPEEAEKYRLKAGQLLMTEGGDRDKLGRGCLWNGEIENCIHQNHVFSVQTDDRLTVRYLDYLTTSEVARVYFDVTAKKTTNLACTSKSTIQKFVIPIPSVTEQRAICNYLDEKCQKLDRVLQKKESIIEQLDSYKKSVIYEYITGKKEV